jgi:uncharacterized protein (DUF1697 family)
MNIYVALLRGINVGGRKVVKMQDLKAVFESLDFHSVRTYIQSGNVIFAAAEEHPADLQNRIERKLEEVLGYKVTAIIRTVRELEQVIQGNPFVGKADDGMLYVTFLAEAPTAEAIDRLASYRNGEDDVHVASREVYLICRNGYGRTLFSNDFLESKLGVQATTRNWQTVNRIASLVTSDDLSNRA